MGRRGSFFLPLERLWTLAAPLRAWLGAKVADEFGAKKRRTMFDLSIFTTPDSWITLVSLMFLEIVLGVDNLVFISITTNRLPEDKQHIGRKLGLAGALVMRVIFLSFASFLVHMTNPLFTIDLGPYAHGFSVRDLVLLAGGVYLIFKGISELRSMLALTEVKAEHSEEHKALHSLTLPQAVGTIMVMDLVFSIDSVITAVGMADHLIIMIIAVMVAVFIMMIFIDPISNFINGHPEMKMLALTFIIAIGALLVIDAAGFHTGIELLHMPLEKLIVYFAMVFSIVLEVIQMRYNKNYEAWRSELWATHTADQLEKMRGELAEQLDAERERRIAAEAEAKATAKAADRVSGHSGPVYQPVIMGSTVYMMMPVDGADPAMFRSLSDGTEASALLQEPIEIEVESVEDAAASVATSSSASVE